jgi:hypothetical protein
VGPTVLAQGHLNLRGEPGRFDRGGVNLHRDTTAAQRHWLTDVVAPAEDPLAGYRPSARRRVAPSASAASPRARKLNRSWKPPRYSSASALTVRTTAKQNTGAVSCPITH